MTFKEQIEEHSKHVASQKEHAVYEADVQSSLVEPLLEILGYNIRKPNEVRREFPVGMGKKDDRVDIVIMRDGKPVILVECKDLKVKFDDPGWQEQLRGYFNNVGGKYGVLTNGVKYRFYTDCDAPNKMDKEQFFEFDITNMKEEDVVALELFHKSNFDLERTSDEAKTLKYRSAIKDRISKEIYGPSDDLVRCLVKPFFRGNLMSDRVTEFATLIKTSFEQVIRDKAEDMRRKEQQMQAVAVSPENLASIDKETNPIVTTEEEMEGFYTVRAALHSAVSMERITHKDTATYFGILFDGNIRKTICRLYFNSTKKYISTFDENKKETKHELTKMDDIFKHTDTMIQTIKYYDDPARTAKPTEVSEPEA